MEYIKILDIMDVCVLDIMVVCVLDIMDVKLFLKHLKLVMGLFSTNYNNHYESNNYLISMDFKLCIKELKKLIVN
jgi:hypothetical protein